jgi:hypothetical protein
MLDSLLVLGEIPGTDYEITFSQVVGLYLLAPGLWVVRKKLLLPSPKRTLRQILTQLYTKKGQQLKLPL